MFNNMENYHRKLTTYIADMVIASHSNFQNVGLDKDNLILILQKAISFIGTDCFLEELSKTENSDLLNSFIGLSLSEKTTSAFLKDISKKYIETEYKKAYESRKDNYHYWKGSSVNREIKVQMCFQYIIKEDCEYSDFINFLDNLNRNRYYQDIDALRMKEVILGLKNKDTYINNNYPKTLKGMKDYKRGTYHCGYIATGKADKKFIRKMRSEGSGLASLMALKTLVEFKDLYSDFDTLLSLFNDSKHQDVVDFLTNYYSKDKIMYLIGNPLADKKKIEKKLMEE